MTPLVFAGRFLVAFAALSVVTEVARLSSIEPILLHNALLEPAARLLQILGSPAEIYGRALVASDARLNILRGCEGIETLTLAVAAVLAFPSHGRSRLGPILAALLLGWALCVLRLAGLFWALRSAPGAWPTIHGTLAPLLPIVVLSASYAIWVYGKQDHVG